MNHWSREETRKGEDGRTSKRREEGSREEKERTKRGTTKAKNETNYKDQTVKRMIQI